MTLEEVKAQAKELLDKPEEVVASSALGLELASVYKALTGKDDLCGSCTGAKRAALKELSILVETKNEIMADNKLKLVSKIAGNEPSIRIKDLGVLTNTHFNGRPLESGEFDKIARKAIKLFPGLKEQFHEVKKRGAKAAPTPKAEATGEVDAPSE